jgi:membrane protein
VNADPTRPPQAPGRSEALAERERHALEAELAAGEAAERRLLVESEARLEPRLERLRARALRHLASRLALRLAQSVSAHDLSGVSAEMAYRFLLASLPLLLIAISLLHMLQQFAPGSDLTGKLLTVLGGLLPSSLDAPLGSLVRGLSRTDALGLGLTGLIGAAWGAAGAASALSKGLNRAYGIEVERPWWKRELLGLAATIVFPLIAVGAVVLYLLGSDVAHALNPPLGTPHAALAAWRAVRQPITGLALLLGFWVLYRILPHVRQGWRQAFPGALVAVLGWLILAQAFEAYLQLARGISVAIASIGLGIAVLLWFYFFGLVVLLGAEVNAVLRRELAPRIPKEDSPSL